MSGRKNNWLYFEKTGARNDWVKSQMYVRGFSFQNAVKPEVFNRKQVFNSEAPSLFKNQKNLI